MANCGTCSYFVGSQWRGNSVVACLINLPETEMDRPAFPLKDYLAYPCEGPCASWEPLRLKNLCKCCRHFESVKVDIREGAMNSVKHFCKLVFPYIPRALDTYACAHFKQKKG